MHISSGFMKQSGSIICRYSNGEYKQFHTDGSYSILDSKIIGTLHENFKVTINLQENCDHV